MDAKSITEAARTLYAERTRGADNSEAGIFERLLTAFVSNRAGKPVTELTEQHDSDADRLLSKLTSKADDLYLRAELSKLAQQASVSGDDLGRLLRRLADDDGILGRTLKHSVLGKNPKPTSLFIPSSRCTKTNYAARMELHIAEQQRKHPSGELDF